MKLKFILPTILLLIISFSCDKCEKHPIPDEIVEGEWESTDIGAYLFDVFLYDSVSSSVFMFSKYYETAIRFFNGNECITIPQTSISVLDAILYNGNFFLAVNEAFIDSIVCYGCIIEWDRENIVNIWDNDFLPIAFAIYNDKLYCAGRFKNESKFLFSEKLSSEQQLLYLSDTGWVNTGIEIQALVEELFVYKNELYIDQISGCLMKYNSINNTSTILSSISQSGNFTSVLQKLYFLVKNKVYVWENDSHYPFYKNIKNHFETTTNIIYHNTDIYFIGGYLTDTCVSIYNEDTKKWKYIINDTGVNGQIFRSFFFKDNLYFVGDFSNNKELIFVQKNN